MQRNYKQIKDGAMMNCFRINVSLDNKERRAFEALELGNELEKSCTNSL